MTKLSALIAYFMHLVLSTGDATVANEITKLQLEGLSRVWAIAEYCDSHIKDKTINPKYQDLALRIATLAEEL